MVFDISDLTGALSLFGHDQSLMLVTHRTIYLDNSATTWLKPDAVPCRRYRNARTLGQPGPVTVLHAGRRYNASATRPDKRFAAASLRRLPKVSFHTELHRRTEPRAERADQIWRPGNRQAA